MPGGNDQWVQLYMIYLCGCMDIHWYLSFLARFTVKHCALFPFPYLLECYSLLLSSGKAFLVGIGSGSNVASITWVTVGRQFVLGS